MKPWTRRRFLATLPWIGAATACGPAPRRIVSSGVPADLTGSIVGASRELGHRLRTGDLPEAPEPGGEIPVLVLGAGIAGLSAGWAMRREGFDDFRILELENDPGGNSRSGRNSVSAFPWGAHYLPQPPDEAVEVRALLLEMGLAREADDGRLDLDPRHLCHDPDERLFLYGGWQEGVVPTTGVDRESHQQLVAFDLEMRRLARLRGEDGRPAFTLPVEASSREPTLLALDRLSMGEWLEERGWTSPALRWWVDYACRDDFGAGVDDTSAWAGCHYFAARPQDAAVLTWPEGNGRLVDHLVDRIGDRIETGQLVYRIEQSESVDGGAWVYVLDTTTSTAHRWHARQVIFALPRFLAPYLMPGVPRDLALPGPESWVYSPWVVGNLTLDHLPREHDGSIPPHSTWDNVDYRSPSLGYVVATHQALSTTPGPTVLTWYRALADQDPLASRRAMEERSWESWAEEILADLERIHPWIRDEVRHLDVMLWGHAMIRPTPGFLWGEARRRAAEPLGPIHFAHSDLGGLSLFEEAQHWGVRAARQVLEVLA